jgi:hypothetical protein
MINLQFYDPSGALKIMHQHAPRLDTLAGKKIGILSNGQWQAYRMLPLLKQLIEADFPDATVIGDDQFPQGTSIIGQAATVQMVKDSGVDAVIIGNAA